MIRVSLCLLLGVLAPQLSSFPLGFDRLLAVFVAVLLLLPWLRRCDLLLAFCGGILFWLAATTVIESRISTEMVGDSLLSEIRIVSFPRQQGTSASFVATADGDTRIPGRISVSWYEPPVDLRLGDIWRVELRLKRPRGSGNPGTADFEAWLLRQRIAASGYVVSGRHNVLLQSDTARGIDRVRLNFVERIERVVRNRESAAVIAAIVVGTRHAMSAEQWQRYTRTGTSHLMAISGLHIGLAAAGSYFLAALLLGLVGRLGNYHQHALVVALLVATAYAVVSGFAVPARRATLMLAILTVVLLLRRDVCPFRILAAAATVVMITDPLATMAPGFKLSFAAVCLLFWHAKRCERQAVPWLLKPVHAIRRLAAMQLALFVGLLPLTVLIFDRVSLAAPLVNLLAVPLFSVLIVPLALFSLVLASALPAIANVALIGAGMGVSWLEHVLMLVARQNGSSYPVAELNVWTLLALYTPLVWLLLPKQWPGAKAAWIGVSVVILWKPPGPPPACVDISTLDVGQGQMLVLQTHSRTLVYDTGPAYRGGSSAAQRVLLPYLAFRGISGIDRLLVSHADLDHAGGVQVLLDNIDVGTIHSGEDLPWIDTSMSRCTSELSWQWEGVHFSFLHPFPGWMAPGNDSSCVLLIEAGSYRALLTGDIESKVEAVLVAARTLPRVDVVSVPHHGSRTSSTAPFVHSLAPAIALVSAGHNNRWGFPKNDVVARWRNIGAKVLNTADSGAIRFRMCANSGVSEPVEYRKQSRRMWHEVK